MKLNLICCGLSLIFALSCTNERTFTSEEIQKDDDGFNPKGTYFWDEFSSLQKYYDLTNEESEMLGFWTGLEESSSSDYEFYPNKLLVIDFGMHKFRGEEDASLTDAFGTWHIKNNILTAKIYGFFKYRKKTDFRLGQYEYIAVSPYEINIIDTKYIDSLGYSRKPFMGFIFPKEIRGKIIVPEGYSRKVHMVRSLYSIDVITDSGKPEKDYWFFKYVPDMLENGFSGLDIATNPELVYRYFAKTIPLPLSPRASPALP